MGVKSSKEVNLIHSNINILIELGTKIDNGLEINKKYVKSLYKTFYYPTHSLTKLEEMNSNHYNLYKILKKQIELYNNYNSTNINVTEYVKNTYRSLGKTLYIIGV